MRKIVSWLILLSVLCTVLPGAVLAEEEQTVVFCTGINKVCLNDSEVIPISDHADTRPFLQGTDIYLPFEFALTIFGGTYAQDGDILTLTTPQGKTWSASVRRAVIWQKPSKVENFNIISVNHIVFVELETFAAFAGLTYSEEEGMVALAKLGHSVDLNDIWINQLQSKLYYERPSAERILSDLKAYNQEEAHPRIMARSGDFERIRELIKTDELVRSWYNNVKRAADASLDKLPLRYELRDGLRLMYVTGEIKTMVYNLALCYQVEQDPKYAQRVWEELSTAADYPDWHPDHYLDTAQALMAFAVGYDWCYDYYTPEQRATLANAMIGLGLTPARQMYDNTFVGSDPNWNRNGSVTWDWKSGSSNWNPWCNGAIICASLAIADEFEPEFCTQMISDALRWLENALPAYAPDGASEEGVGYGLGSMSYIVELDAAMMSALGTDYDYFYVPGISEFVNFPIYMNGPAGKFNYHDSGNEAPQYMPETFYFAIRLNKPSLAVQRVKDLKDKRIASDIKDILWYRPEEFSAAAGEELNTDIYFRKVETGSFRSSWDDPYAFYLAFHGGENNVSHMHYDAGTFVMDAMGERWACDLGSETLTYVSNGQTFNRYDLYRIKAEGHNTLYINPSLQADQEMNAWNPVEQYVSKPAGGFAIMNLTNAYKKYVSSARRGFALTDSRTKVIIQDEIEFLDKSELYWGMHTRAQVELSGDKRTAILTLNGKRLRASLISEDGVFESFPAAPLPQSATVIGQSDDSADVTKLAVHVKDTKKTTVCVEFTCIMEDADLERQPGAVVPLDEWTVHDTAEELPELKNIYINGEPLDDFSPTCKNYNIYMPLDTEEIPKITADGGENTVEIVPPADYANSSCRIEVRDESGAHSIYYLYLLLVPQAGTPENAEKLEPADVSCSSWQNEPGEVHPAKDALDGNLDTRWSASGKGEWLQVDLGTMRTVNYASLSFASGDSRIVTFDIQISEDGLNWQTIYGGDSTGTTAGMETYRLEEAQGRYVRFVGYGNTTNTWNSVQEFELYTKRN